MNSLFHLLKSPKALVWCFSLLLLSRVQGGDDIAPAAVGTAVAITGRIFSGTWSRRCMAPNDAAPEGTTTRNVVQWNCDGSNRQQWIFEPVGTVFRIKNANSSKCLTIPAASLMPGMFAVEDECTAATSMDDHHHRPEQLWHVSGQGKYRKIRPYHSTYCLKIQFAGRHLGAPILQSPCSDSLDEFWSIGAPIVIPTLPSLWDGPYGLPLVAVAAANLPDGKILTWSAYKRFDFLTHNGTLGTGKTYTTIFDPETKTYTEALVQNTHHDMFCPGTAQLGDGRIMITGGSDSNATTLYDPASNTWSIGPHTVVPRGYHSMTVLHDGSVFTIGGSFSGGEGNKTGELWNVTTGEWIMKSNLLGGTLLTNDSRGVYRSDNHMWLQVAPNGKIFHAGPSAQMNWLHLDGDGSIEPSIYRGDDTDAMNGNAVMYDVGKILTLGGALYYENSLSSHRAYVIHLDGDDVSVERVGNMTYPRSFSSSVVLPTGEVVVVGGMNWAYIFTDEGAIYTAEIWNPNTRNFSLLAEMKVPRNYHAIGILLKDGRVMAAGGGLCGNCTVNHNDTEILTPPYLLNPDKTPATRPIIVSAPNTIIPGGTINVTMDTNNVGHSFALVRASVVTHAINNDQRRIPLNAVHIEDNTFSLLIPANPHVVLPGNYFLFAMNENNVPSIAEIVNRPNQYAALVVPTFEVVEKEKERLEFSTAAAHHTPLAPSPVQTPAAAINMGAAANVALLVVVVMCSIPLRRKLIHLAPAVGVIDTEEEFV